MGKMYRATGTVIIAKDVTVDFEDDGETDLMDQAHEALCENDDIPISLMTDIDEISNVSCTEVAEA